jgi:hypothetical protein
LFPRCCWLQRPRAGQEITRTPEVFDAALSLTLLEEMLVECDDRPPKGAYVDIAVSDNVGVAIALPWHAALTSTEELQAYAAVCFEQGGMEGGQEWVVRGDYRRHGGAGMAYALPRGWMTAVLDLLQSRGLKLGSVLPVSGLAYWRYTPRRSKRSLIVLQESFRTTALIFDGGTFCGLDVEPDAGDADRAGKRLMSRIQSRTAAIDTVWYWTPCASAHVPGFLGDTVPDATLGRLPRGMEPR